jgi:Gluconate 2-dehydrogenase subunit 3
MNDRPDHSNIIPIEPVDSRGSAGIHRREALQTLLGTVGAGFALPAIADPQHPVQEHLSSPTVVEQARQKAAVSAYTAAFLDAQQMKTLESLAETIVPGSRAARVAPFLDQLIAVESAKNQSAFLGALGAFDMAAITKHGKAWNALAAGEQDALMREASTGEAAMSTLRGHFQNLKAWIAGAYYSSEAGMRELGWTGNMFHQQLPGCTHSGGHQA